MIRAFYSGREGLQAQQTAMDDISNNIANLDTTGYKSQSTRFSDVLYSSMLRPTTPGYATELAGNGVATAQIEPDMSGGEAQPTDSALDYAVNGPGFFAVQDTAGNTFYTRNGSFTVEPGQGGAYLENAQGLFVLDAAGQKIPATASGPSAAPGVFDFSNSQGLLEAGGSLFTQSSTSGAPVASAEGFKTGYLESSNVDLSSQMEQMIVTQRGYQMSSRVIQTADQIASMTNELKP